MPDATAPEQLPPATGEPISAARALPPAENAVPTPGGGDGARPEHPEDVDALRDDIERTRDRMSQTLDRIEDRIVRRRDEMWSKATLQDVRTTITNEPWRSLLIAFAAGYVYAALRD